MSRDAALLRRHDWEYDDLVSLGNVVNASTSRGIAAVPSFVLRGPRRPIVGPANAGATTSSDDVINQHLWRTIEPCWRRGTAVSTRPRSITSQAVTSARAALNVAREYGRKGATAGDAVVARHSAFLGLG